MPIDVTENKVGKKFLWFLGELEKDGWIIGNMMFPFIKEGFKKYCEDYGFNYNELIIEEMN